MPAALASPCRIKRKRHRWRRCASGRTVLTDALGSTRALTNAAGNVVNRYDYTPYGQTTQTASGFSNPYQYTGRERDQSGMYYYRARYYSSGMSRFISEDPIGLAGGDLNTHAYVGGDPISRIDPLGLADLILLAPGAPGYTGAQALNPPGVYSVVGHGNPSTVNNGYGTRLTPTELAAVIKADPNYTSGTPVELYACRTGQGNYGSELAAELGANVYAPNNYVFLYSNGNTIIAGKNNPGNGRPNMSNVGQMVLFPGSP